MSLKLNIQYRVTLDHTLCSEVWIFHKHRWIQSGMFIYWDRTSNGYRSSEIFFEERS